MVTENVSAREKVNNYELTVIFKGDLSEEKLTAAIENVKKFIAGKGGAVSDAGSPAGDHDDFSGEFAHLSLRRETAIFAYCTLYRTPRRFAHPFLCMRLSAKQDKLHE